MQNLRKVYQKNSILQFWGSYLIVLIVPLVIVFCGFQYMFHVVEEDAKSTNITMLDHSVKLLDSDLSSLEAMALQASQSVKLHTIGDSKTVNADFSLLAIDVMNEFYGLMRYQGINVLDEAYIYLNNFKYVMYDSTLYRSSIFQKYVRTWGMSFEEWKVMCENSGKRVPRYIPSAKNTLNYVIPFGDTFKSENLGAIVFRLNNKGINQFFDYSGKYGKYAIYILNTENEIIWSEDRLGFEVSLQDFDIEKNSFVETKDERITSVSSETTDWKYVLVLPEKEVLQKITVIKIIIFSLLIIAIFAGVICSLILAIKAGRPINHIFQSFKESDDIPRNSANLGKIVKEVVKSNQRYIEELEEDKPLLQKAFFHDLVKAELVNTTEIRYMAEKAGISLHGKNFRIATLKLFANNDFYDVDEQTIEEVRILMKVVMDHLEEISKEPIWFYKNDYLTTSVIFCGNDELNDVKSLVEQTSQWIYTLYSVETRWGVSNCSKDLLNVWKICEEAMTALNSSDSQNHIVEYQKQLENSNNYYFPDIVQERIKSGIQFGDMKRIENVLEILKQENFENRNLNRNRFIKLNSRIVEMFSQFNDSVVDVGEQILWLNEMVFQYEEGMQESYFERLRLICEHMCQGISQKKSVQRGKLINNIMKYITENYKDSNLGLAKISTEFGISEGYVSSVFKEQAGVNFADYVERLRIEQACQLLKKDECMIADISELVGYNSVQSFRRAFKRVVGIQPKEYRKE